MFRRTAAAVLTGVAVIVLSACAASRSSDAASPGPAVGIGHGSDIPLANATTNAKSLPATALFSAGPYDLRAKLRAYNMGSLGDDTLVWIDGTRHFGLEALAGLTLDDIVQVDVVRGIWGGLSGSGAISITTKRGQQAGK